MLLLYPVSPMRTALALVIVGTVTATLWLSFELLARASRSRPVHPWTE